MATYLPNLLGMGPQIPVQMPFLSQQPYYGLNPVQSPFAYAPQASNPFTPISAGYTTRADRMEEVRRLREVEEAARKAAAPPAALLGMPDEGGDSAAPSGNTPDYGSLEIDAFNKPAQIGNALSIAGVPFAGTAGERIGMSRANKRLDELIDPALSKGVTTQAGRKVAAPTLAMTPFSFFNPFSSFTNPIGDQFMTALDTRAAELDPLTTNMTMDQLSAAVDAAYDRNPELAEYTDDFMQGAYGVGPGMTSEQIDASLSAQDRADIAADLANFAAATADPASAFDLATEATLAQAAQQAAAAAAAAPAAPVAAPTTFEPTYDELMATGGMSNYGQTFDSLPDIPDTARFDFSDLDEFGNPTVSYDNLSDAVAGSLESLGNFFSGGSSAPDDVGAPASEVGNTTAEVGNQHFDPDLPNDGLDEDQTPGSDDQPGTGTADAPDAGPSGFSGQDADDPSSDENSEGCVIATHALSTNAFTKRDRAKAIAYCKKKYHGRWYGELFRQGYQHLGKKAIERGEAANHYDEFKNFVAVGRGKSSSLKNKLNFYRRTAQFFAVGCYLKLKEKIHANGGK